MTYALRRDGIEITTTLLRAAEFYPHEGVVDPVTAQPLNPLDDSRLKFPHLLPLVQVEFEKRPLREALQELAEATDWTVVLDERAADNSKPVTATLVNVPLDTAVELLADMVGLTVIRRNKSLYVTTTENAVALSKTRMRRPSFLGGMGGIAGLQGGMGLQGGIGGLQGGGQIGGGNAPLSSGKSSPPSTPQAPSASATVKPAPPELERIQMEIAKLQAEIAKLQAELTRLQPRNSEPKPEKRNRPEPKGGPPSDPAAHGSRSAFTKPRDHPSPKG
jgi:hypothetical protein